MASTNNATQSHDPEKQALASISSISRYPPSSINDRSPNPETDQHFQSKMPRIQHIFMCFLLLTIFTFMVASASAAGALRAVSLEERLRFKELLESVEPAALHQVLHEHLKDKYQHGVYQEDKTAMEVVHRSNAEVAQNLVELAKRQSTSNSTATTSAAVPTSTVVSTQNPSATSQAPVSSSLSAAQTGSTGQQPTTTAGVQTTQPSASSAVPTTTNIVVITTPGASTTPTTAGPSSTNVPSTLVVNTSNAPTTSRSVTQSIVYTTTLANGSPTTVTSVTVVPADQAQKTGSSTKTQPNASLQTNGGNSNNPLGMTGLLGAIGMVVVGAL